MAISLYGIEFLPTIGERLAVEGDKPDIGLKEGGYLFLATAGGRAILEQNHQVQVGHGADILFLEPDELVRLFPASGRGSGRRELGADRGGLVRRLRAHAGVPPQGPLPRRSLPIGRRGRLRHGRWADHDGSPGRRHGGRLRRGRECGRRRGSAIARAAGVEIPVRNKKRMIFSFDCKDPVPHCPLMIDGGVYVRPEGRGFICGSSPPVEQDPDAEDFEVDYGFFEDVIWPTLAHRVPAFEQIRPGRAWAGHYDMNQFDHNAFVGRAPGLDNFYLANGFSGHGLQQAPAVGRGLSELIVSGRFRTLDLTPLSFDRLLANRPLVERNVV